ncbi:cyclase family protein [Thiotrichales bacterium 19X7-9]|nr:cyclase family protein [Thiotrichales bacterium 19X7-9]
MKLGLKFIDLTHTLTADTPTWDRHCGFKYQIAHDYADGEEVDNFRIQHLNINAGIGTHIDAPNHYIEGASSIADLQLSELISPCVKVDVSKKADETYQVSVADLASFEARHGRIKRGVMVIFYSGWSKFWQDKKKYHNNYRFPSVSKEACEYLLERDIAGIGIDTLSPDVPDSGYPVHNLLLAKNKYIVENIANADKLPEIGAYSIALPIKGAFLTEAPMRLVAFMPNKK